MVVAAAFLVACAAASAANPSLVVTFYADGTISVTLPDGTPVGSQGGTPTSIPAGYYTVMLSGPGGCVPVPTFTLSGPGVSIVNNLDDGEVNGTGYNADFLPDTTYTWSDAASPAVVYSFTTSALVEGSPPAPTAPTAGPPAATASNVASQDVVGSAVAMPPVSSLGTLEASVNATGHVTLRLRGHVPASVAAGRYTLTITDASTAHGLALDKVGHATMDVSVAGFVGKRSLSVDLTAGRWVVTTRPASTATSFDVRG